MSAQNGISTEKRPRDRPSPSHKSVVAYSSKLLGGRPDLVARRIPVFPACHGVLRSNHPYSETSPRIPTAATGRPVLR
jgi:hypothetical protein